MFWTVEINFYGNIFGRALKGQRVVIECYTPFNKEQRADAKSTTSYFLQPIFLGIKMSLSDL